MVNRSGFSAALAVLCTSLALIVLVGCGGTKEFKGTVLTSGDHAPAFELTNQFGNQIRLGDYQGDPVLLTFLYTNCPDVCPITASQLRQTLDSLGDDGERVRVAALSLDPERDTIDAAADFSDRWEMTEDWDFLIGDREVLEPLWGAYYLDPVVVEQSGSDGSEQANGSSGGLGSLRKSFSDRYLVIHSNPVYLIDRAGIMRVVFTSPLDPEEIAHDVRLLLK